MPELQTLLANTALPDREAFARLYAATRSRCWVICLRLLDDSPAFAAVAQRWRTRIDASLKSPACCPLPTAAQSMPMQVKAFAPSVEPPDGSPTWLPSGPVIMSGAARSGRDVV